MMLYHKNKKIKILYKLFFIAKIADVQEPNYQYKHIPSIYEKPERGKVQPKFLFEIAHQTCLHGSSLIFIHEN